MAKTDRKPPRQAPSEDVFREFAWNVAGAVNASKTGVARPPAKPQAARR